MRNGRPTLRVAGAVAVLALAPMTSRAGSAQDPLSARLQLLIPRLMARARTAAPPR
jgi:hypothetical protein